MKLNRRVPLLKAGKINGRIAAPRNAKNAGKVKEIKTELM